MYKTDESGRPSRFLSHREAAWWPARKAGTFFGPLFVSPILWAIFGQDAPGRQLIALPVMGALLVLRLLAAGAVYLFVALSGGVMHRAERQDHR